MELKSLQVMEKECADEGSNRTFMELNQLQCELDSLRDDRSNRTFMELNLLRLLVPPCAVRVLIVPLWN